MTIKSASSHPQNKTILSPVLTKLRIDICTKNIKKISIISAIKIAAIFFKLGTV